MAERRFVLAPLADLAPDLRHPVTHRSVREMLDAAPPNRRVRPVTLVVLQVQDLYAALKRYWGYDSFRPMQERIIQSLMERPRRGRGDAHRAAASRCATSLPALVSGQTVVVISPLIALMQDQVAQLADMGIPAAVLNSSPAARGAAQRDARRRAGRVPPAVPFARAPGAAGHRRPGCSACRWPFSPSTKRTASPNGATSSARSTGSSARCARTFPTSRSPPSPPAPRAACGTTFWTSSSFATRTSTSPASTAPTCATSCTSARRATQPKLLLKALRAYEGESVIVYAPTIAEVEAHRGLPGRPRASPPIPYHGQMETAARRRNQERWMNDEVRVLVGTIAFGLGINKPAVRAVIHLRCRNRSSSITRKPAAPGATDCLPIACCCGSRKDAGLLAYFIDQLQDPDREGPRLAALPHHPQFRGKLALPPSSRSACTSARRPKWQRCEMCDVCGNVPEWLQRARRASSRPSGRRKR